MFAGDTLAQMKTTFLLDDSLFERAQRATKQRGITMRELVEQGLRAVLAEPRKLRYRIPDCSVGLMNGDFPLLGMSWGEVRATIYGDDD